MTRRNQSRCLWVLSIALVATACATIVSEFVPRSAAEEVVRDQVDRKADAALRPQPQTPLSSPPLSKQDFAAFWERKLRLPLYDPPPPPPPVVEKKQLPPLRTKLLATMVESQGSTALLKLPNGDVVFRKIGDALGADDGDAKIARIEAGKIVVRRGMEDTELMVETAKRSP